MDDTSRAQLSEHLEALRDRRNILSMLFMRPKGTSRGFIGEVREHVLWLVLPHVTWRELRRPWRFWRCGMSRGWAMRLERMGPRPASRLRLGRDIAKAVDHVDACYDALYGTRGWYELEFMSMGWHPNPGYDPNA